MAKVRVYELARDFNLDSKELVKKLKAGGLDVKNYMSTLDEESAAKARDIVAGRVSDVVEEKRIKPVVIRRRKKIVKVKPEPPLLESQKANEGIDKGVSEVVEEEQSQSTKLKKKPFEEPAKIIKVPEGFQKTDEGVKKIVDSEENENTFANSSRRQIGEGEKKVDEKMKKDDSLSEPKQSDVESSVNIEADKIEAGDIAGRDLYKNSKFGSVNELGSQSFIKDVSVESAQITLPEGANLNTLKLEKDIKSLGGKKEQENIREASFSDKESKRERSPLDNEFIEDKLELPSDLDHRIESCLNGLALEKEVVLQVIQALHTGNHVIITGPPGTAKTVLAKNVCSEIFSRIPFMVTATADWTTQDVIGGLYPAPKTNDEEGNIDFVIRRGCAYEAVIQNYEEDLSCSGEYESIGWKRKLDQCYKGTWLVIDELNRADMDKAMGSLFTALSSDHLSVPVLDPNDPQRSQGTIPIPDDFRIIGTLNTYDRHFLFDFSDALKRRFAFIEIGVPRDWYFEREIVMSRLNYTISMENKEVIDQIFDFFHAARTVRELGTAQLLACLKYIKGGLPGESYPIKNRAEDAVTALVLSQLEMLDPWALEMLCELLVSNNKKLIEQIYEDIKTSEEISISRSRSLSLARMLDRRENYLKKKRSIHISVGKRESKLSNLFSNLENVKRKPRERQNVVDNIYFTMKKFSEETEIWPKLSFKRFVDQIEDTLL
ncbi:MAG: translation initiation factor IF-2 N-terminal domain-containing protein [Candidatus Thorarchaeota archaeon]